MKLPARAVPILLANLICANTYALTSDQYASSVLGFSSQYNSSGTYTATQALGAPNVIALTFDTTAWSPAFANGTKEYISLGYKTPVYAYGATIREVRGAGFVYKVDARDTNNVWHTVWQGTDPSPEGKISDFFVSWPFTPYKVNGLRVNIDTDKTLNYEMIDSMELSGVNTNTLPAVSLVAADTVASETLSSTGLFVFTRYLGATAKPLVIKYSILGNAVNGRDYNAKTALTGQVTIPAGVRSVGVMIKPVDDAVKENVETVTLSLTPNVAYQVMTKLSSATVSINSNE